MARLTKQQRGVRQRSGYRQRTPKRAKPLPSLDDCVIPPRIPPEVLKDFVLSGEAEDERQSIRDYVALEAHEKVLHVERVNRERIFGREYEVWDVHTDKSRWWVITSPTNLYSQELFPSADYTLSLHVGLMARVMARQEPATTAEERDRTAVPWRRLQQAEEALEAGDEAEDFQAVGMRCRECLIELTRSLSDPAMVPAGSDAPKAADFVSWSDLIAGYVAPGSGGEEVRRYLRAVAKSTWQYVNWLTHATNAVRFDGRIALDSTSHVLGSFVAAAIRRERGMPDRCPTCRSYQLDSVYDPGSDSPHPYRLVCRRCNWTSASVDVESPA
jgi:hypothetical protein